MKKLSFICYGKDAEEDAFIYSEVPRKEGGEEFFVFFNPVVPRFRDEIKEFYRIAISTSRLGSTENYFTRLLENIEQKQEPGTDLKEILRKAVILVLIKRGKETLFMHNRGINISHWDGSVKKEGWQEIIEDVAIDLGRNKEQADLFEHSIEELFDLKKVAGVFGAHTLVFVPSESFENRNREVFLNSVFFPSFEVPESDGIQLDIDIHLPAIHLSETPVETKKTERFRDKMRKRNISIPLIAGSVAAVLAILIFFGPFSGGDSNRASENEALLTASDFSENTSGPSENGDEETPSDEPGINIDDGVVSDAETSGEDHRLAAIRLSAAWKKKFDKPVTSSPALCSGDIIFGCRDGYIYSFTASGDFRWKYNCGAGVGSSPVALGKGMVAGCDYNGNIHCIDAENGRAVWKKDLGAKIVSTPSVRGEKIFAGTMNGDLYSLDTGDGKVDWKKNLGTAIWGSVVSGKDYIVAATIDGHLVKLDHDGKILWETEPGGEIYSTPICIDNKDLVVLGTNKGLISAFSLSKGALLWQYSVSSEVRGIPVTDGERIIIGTDDGKVYSLSLEGRMFWMQNIEGAVRSKPVIDGDIIYITAYNSRLNAIDKITGNVVESYRVESNVYSSPLKVGESIFFGTNGGFLHSVIIETD